MTVLRDQVSDQRFRSARVIAGDDGGPLNFRMVHEGGLDLTRLDPDAIDLQLVIRTPQILDLPVRTPPGQISSAIQLPTHVRSKRVRNEALRCQFGTIQVSSRDPFAPDVELSNHAD